MNERPMCDYCDLEVIGDHYYYINGEVICPDCLEEYFRKEVPDYEDQDASDPE